MFHPPCCPNRSCPAHLSPTPAFFVRKGFYKPMCRSHAVPRFRCKSCGVGFSRQTFRADYRDHRPDLNAPLVRSLASGVGLRQTARNLGLSLRCTELKFRKLARHLRHLNWNLRGELTEGAGLQFDEFETYEGRRNARPLSVPVLVERDSRFVIWAEAATIRPHGRMSTDRAEAVRKDELRFGRRRDNSIAAIRRTFRRASAMAQGLSIVHLESDEKTVYPRLAREAFGNRLIHHRTSSKLPRTTWNPLFPINHIEALVRDLLGRVRRESWLVSKKRCYLDAGLQLWMAYHNYVRRRFNYTDQSPAQHLRFVDRRMRLEQLISWRQDWGKRSLHPLGRSTQSIRDWNAGQAA